MSDTTTKLNQVGFNLQAFLDAVRAGRQKIQVQLPSNFQGQQGAQLVYGEHVHGVARSAADVMELLPALFPGVTFTADDLRKLEETVRADITVHSQVQGAIDAMQKETADSKVQLCTVITLVRNTVRAAWDNPLTPADVREKLEVHGTPLLQLIQDHFDGVSGRRKANQHLRGGADEKVAQATAVADAATTTTKILRGADAPVTAALPAAAKHRKRKTARPTPSA